ncbi:MAG TPA: hypothetical protein VGI81_14130 [Tepidisphaeraceae bacterium]|jgi:hypothetical protein
MSQENAVNHDPLKALAKLLREHPQQEEEKKAPAVTDRHILAAMIGKPWWRKDDEGPAPEVRKAS